MKKFMSFDEFVNERFNQDSKKEVPSDTSKVEDKIEESIDSRVRAKIVVHLKNQGIKHGEDYDYSGGEFLAKNMDVAQNIADAAADKFRVAIYDDRITKDGRVPMMIVEGWNHSKPFMGVWNAWDTTGGGLDKFLRYTNGADLKKAIKQHMDEPSKLRQMDYVLTVPPESRNPKVENGELRNGRDTYQWTIFDFKGVNILAVEDFSNTYYFINTDDLNESKETKTFEDTKDGKAPTMTVENETQIATVAEVPQTTTATTQTVEKPIAKEDIKGFHKLDSIKKDIENSKVALEKMKTLIDKGVKDKKLTENYVKLLEHRTNLIKEMNRIIEETKQTLTKK